MNRCLFAASALSTAIGLAIAMQAQPTGAQGMANPPQIVKDNMARMQSQHLEKCYGINAAAKNDCAEGPIPAPARRRRRAIPNPSCYSLPATAPRSRAAA
jgi:uncharacterized membrane protein